MKNFRIIVWFGSCSSRQLKGVKIELPKALCGICCSELHPVMYTGANACLVDMKREVANSKGSFDFVSDLYENGELVWTYSVRRWSRLRRISKLAKIRLFVRFRASNGGHFIALVPRKRLVELSRYRKKKWVFEDGWSILEAF